MKGWGTENHQTPALEGNSEIMFLKGKLKPRKVKFCAQVHRSHKIRCSFPSNSKEPFPSHCVVCISHVTPSAGETPAPLPRPEIPSTASNLHMIPGEGSQVLQAN